MRQFARHGTILSFSSFMLIAHLLFLPIIADIQAAENSSPVIAYYPIRVGRYGQPFTIRVHAMSDNKIAGVILVVSDDGKPLRGKMPKLKGAKAPVQVHAVRNAKIYSGPSAGKRVKGMVRLGEVLYVSMEKNGFYRVMGDNGVRGFVLKKDVDVLNTGDAYAVTLPASITSRSTLTYHIEAVDSRGGKSVTKDISMRLLTDDEINGFIAANTGQGKKSTGKAIYKKPLFWGGLAAVGVVAYLVQNNGSSPSDQAAVQVLVEWE